MQRLETSQPSDTHFSSGVRPPFDLLNYTQNKEAHKQNEGKPPFRRKHIMFKTVSSLQVRPQNTSSFLLSTLNTVNEGTQQRQHASLISWHDKSIDKWQLNATRPTSKIFSEKRDHFT